MQIAALAKSMTVSNIGETCLEGSAACVTIVDKRLLQFC